MLAEHIPEPRRTPRDAKGRKYRHGNAIVLHRSEYAHRSFGTRDGADIGEQAMILPSLQWRCLKCS